LKNKKFNEHVSKNGLSSVAISYFNNFWQPDGPGRYVFDFGVEQHGEYVIKEIKVSNILYKFVLLQQEMQKNDCNYF